VAAVSIGRFAAVKICARMALPIATLALALSSPAAAQSAASRVVGRDSVVVVPNPDFAAGSFHRWLLGENYRKEWTTPVKVPVLDLKNFHGGLKPTKKGGGAQTVSLRFEAADGSEWAFRSVRKASTVLPEQYKGTVVWYIMRDEGSASHPMGAVAADPIQSAAGIFHPRPTIAVMPDDPALGEFRKEFAGMLGDLEERPDAPKKGPAFPPDARDILDSDTLLARINADAQTHVDAYDLLTAREVDLLLGDNDRHPDQWKWARFEKGDEGLYEPVAEDRDKAFVSYQGALMSVARLALHTLVEFGSKYADPHAQFANADEFDRRMLQSLDRSVWDSVANALMQRITDQVIDSAVAALPREYAGSSREIAAKLKARRNGLRGAADRYFRELWRVADIHGTDAPDQATVTRSGDGIVDVVIRSGSGAPYVSRRFLASETKEIRIYLHGGDDQATVSGTVRKSIPVRIIGGNGTNVFRDESVVGGRRNPTEFYDVGAVTNVVYARDTVDERINIDNAFNHYFNRRPWLRAYGTLIPPQRDRGATLAPVASLHSQRGLGIYPVVGFSQYVYGFRKVPYSTMTEADIAQATASNRMRIRANFDKRLEESDVHIPVNAYMSQFEVIQFHGFGNDIPDLRGRFYDVRQRQWSFRPAIGRSLSPVSDISLGPVVRYTGTDSIANRLLAQQRPYGFTRFGQAGLQLKMHLDSKYKADTLRPRFVFDVLGSGYPGMWDVATPYESVDGWAAAFFTLPIAKRPVLAFRAGGKKLWGPFPYFDAAFLGGSETFRTEEKQRYAGDASLYGTTELRVPIARFPFILPLDVGALGFADAGRVYVNGDSPGGWHTAEGAGFWVGYLNPGTNFNVLFTNRKDRRVTTSVGFAF
jgi:hypothetical protein